MKKLLSIITIICSISLLPLNETSCFCFHRHSGGGSGSTSIINTITNAKNVTAKGSNLNEDSSDNLTKKNILNDIGIKSSDQSKVTLSGDLNSDSTQTAEITFTIGTEIINKEVTWLKISTGEISEFGIKNIIPIKNHPKECITLAVQSGVYKSIDNGNSFVKIPTDFEKPVSILSANNGDIYIGTQLMGLWKSSDNGKSFQQVADPDLGICNYLYQDNKNDIWLCTSYGLWKSTNGTNFTKLNINDSNEIICYTIFENDNTVFVGTNAGLFLSIDNGSIFTKSDQTPDFNITNIELSGNILYFGTSSGVYKSTDNGENISQLSNNQIPTTEMSLGIYYDSTNTTTYFGSGSDSFYRTSDDEHFDDISYNSHEAANITNINSVLFMSGDNVIDSYDTLGIWYYAIDN